MLEALCLGIVALWIALRTPMATDRGRFFGQIGLVMALAWVGEQSCISLYGFYGYAPRWWWMLGDVPLTVVLIWPVVVLSARDVVLAMVGPRPLRVGLACLLVITADAAFIEPAAVHSALWYWTQPGVFGVPPVGIAGWGVFGGLMAGALQWLEAEKRGPIAHGAAAVAVLAGMHLGLLALWWGGLRWLSAPIADLVAAMAVGVMAVGVCVWLWRSGRTAPRRLVLLRMPGALFFAVLLTLSWPPVGLALWLAALSLPWALLVVRGAGDREATALVPSAPASRPTAGDVADGP